MLWAEAKEKHVKKDHLEKNQNLRKEDNVFIGNPISEEKLDKMMMEMPRSWHIELL